jgi:tetratricopeptide (TPR) repeat protein
VSAVAAVLVLLAVAVGSGTAHAIDPQCRGLEQWVSRGGYGPYDYRLRHGATKSNLELVEVRHFMPEHQRSALRGEFKTYTGGPSGWEATFGTLHYTLGAFPNHARAMYLMGIYHDKVAKGNPSEFEWLKKQEYYSPPQCYYQRAERLFPDDPNIYNSQGMAFSHVGRHEEAIERFQVAVKLAPKSGDARYNLALAYFAAGKFENSRDAAREAYRLGYDRQELKLRLQKKGMW